MRTTESLARLETPGRREFSDEPRIAEAAPEAFGQLITPAEQRFVRCHFAVPELDGRHAVELQGAVARPLRLSLAELRSLPALTQTVLTECAGNGRASLSPPAEGDQWTTGGVSCAQWTGVPLRTLLEQAGLRDTAVELVFTGADVGYARSLPRDAAGDALLALEMNGEPIPPLFGGPLRLVVPGWYGMASVKWLTRIEAVEQPFTGEFQTNRYVYAKGLPVTRVRVKSLFTRIAPPLIEGLAWGGVARVEVSCGGGWREARLLGPALPHAWRRFELRWTPPAHGEYVLRCRATGLNGETQPEEPQWNEGGYGANGIQSVRVQA